jgi:peptidoglycan/LPS O-acetylase OafA/YrhL
MGGLLAYLNTRSAMASFRFRLMSLVLGVPVYAATRFFGMPNPVLFDLAYAGICVSLVHHAAVGVKGPARFLLDLPPLQYLGKISYSVYLFHNFSEPATAILFRRAHLEMPTEPGLRFLVLAGATILAATVSWYVIEKPINNLKRYFPYVRRAQAKTLASYRLSPVPQKKDRAAAPHL